MPARWRPTAGYRPARSWPRRLPRRTQSTGEAAAYFVLNCAHPTHFRDVLEDAPRSRRIRGVACNASCKSHAELDQSDKLDAGDPVEFGRLHREQKERLPWLNVFGGCCGCDYRRVCEITRNLFP